jgi:uncharacterized protein (TIGR03083 family)
MPPLEHRQYCDRLAGAIDDLAALVGRTDHGAPVPTCPGWSVGKLAKHVGLTQRWATQMVETRATERLDQRSVELDWPDDPSAVPGWLRDGAAVLTRTLRAADPDAGMWAWGADQHVRFWSRRMVHEALVHTADVQVAAGAEPTYPADLAPDAVDEMLENLPAASAFAAHVRELRGDGESIHLHSTDVEGEWMIELGADGFRWRHDHGKGTVAVHAAAADLALLLYRRRPLDGERFEIFGDRAVLDHWIDHSAH